LVQKADGGIILTASHNPKQWNALKLLNGKFLNGIEGEKFLSLLKPAFDFSDVDSLGKLLKMMPI
jgi:phosphomannomutase